MKVFRHTMAMQQSTKVAALLVVVYQGCFTAVGCL